MENRGFHSLALTSPNLSSRPTSSCIRCSDRKVRCDRQNPCAACVKHHAQCVFRPHQPPRRKQKRAKGGHLEEKLKRYEALLQKLGVDPNGLPNDPEAEQRHADSDLEAATTEDASQSPTPASSAVEREQSISTSQLLHGQGRSKFVDKGVHFL